jgi:predicted RNase H-like HicB family nuclease
MAILIDDEIVEPTTSWSVHRTVGQFRQADAELTLSAGVTVIQRQDGLQLVPSKHIPQTHFELYRKTALKHAAVRQLDDQTWYAEIPEFPGVWANEDNPLDCLTVLDEVLTEWLLFKIEHEDRDIPVIEDIDLNVI